MRSVLYYRHGVPSEVLETVEVPAPPPPPPGQVVVRVRMRPVHYGDLLGVAGRYRSGGDLSVPPEGNRVGFEGLGEIAFVGEGVDLQPGTRVAFFPGRGAWSEYTTVAAEFVTPLPDDLPDETGAQLHVNPVTAALLRRAVDRAVTVPGRDVVVLTAAGSAVARLTITALAAADIAVIGLVRSDRGAQELRGRMPWLPVLSTANPHWKENLADTIGSSPIRAVLDPVGGALASELANLLASGGSLISYGDLSGEPISVSALSFSTRDIRIFGVTVGTWAQLPAAQRAEDLQFAIDLARHHPDLFPVSARYDLADARDAASHVESPGKAGVVLMTS